MKSILAISATVLTSLISTTTTAQDLLANAGSVTRSYNYVEGFYLLTLEDDLPDGADVDFPALFRISVDLNERFSIFGEYINQTYTLGIEGISAEFDADSYELSLRYRDTLHAIPDTDWVAGVGFGNVEFGITIEGESASADENVLTSYLGIRRTLSQRLEGELGINFFRLTSGGSISGSGDAALVYRLAKRLDVALGVIDLTEDNNYGIGLRYTWN